jgi:site-specific DNA-methyltransferase (adenine-specific)
MAKIKLILGDCLNKMKEIDAESIDLILTDPPYGTTQCKWDSIIPFDLMWKELKRIIKDNGCIALFGSEPFSSYLRTSNIKWFKYDWIWNKKNIGNPLIAKYQPLRQHEIITIFYNKSCNYYPIKTNLDIKRDWKQYNKTDLHGKVNVGVSGKTKGKYPKSIIEFSNAVRKKLHPTQKPVALLEYLIKTYTNENDIVLDFTMGSGSTGIAAKNLNREFIGIELDLSYFKIAEARIDGKR